MADHPSDSDDPHDPGNWMGLPPGTHWRENPLLCTSEMRRTKLEFRQSECIHGVTMVVVVATSASYGICAILGRICTKAEMADFIAFVRGRMGERGSDYVETCRGFLPRLDDLRHTVSHVIDETVDDDRELAPTHAYLAWTEEAGQVAEA